MHFKANSMFLTPHARPPPPPRKILPSPGKKWADAHDYELFLFCAVFSLQLLKLRMQLKYYFIFVVAGHKGEVSPCLWLCSCLHQLPWKSIHSSWHPWNQRYWTKNCSLPRPEKWIQVIYLKNRGHNDTSLSYIVNIIFPFNFVCPETEKSKGKES